jgi:hypothetical protein
MKLGFRLLALLGTLFFGFALALTFATPEFVERVGSDFIKQRIEQETHEKIDSLTLSTGDSRLGRLAQKVLDGQQERIDTLKSEIKARADAKIADVFAQMSVFDCECRARFEAAIDRDLWMDLTLAQVAVAKVEEFLEAKYVDVVRKLRTDLRIFLGSNLLAFLALLLVAFAKPGATAPLLVPGAILMTAVVICSYFYVFQQNWFFTIIYGDYVGFAYVAYLGSVFGFLCDIVLNCGRVTTWLLNLLMDAIGSTLTFEPC